MRYGRIANGHGSAALVTELEVPRGLASMLEARSVAVVGASTRAGSVGRQTMEQLLVGGFEGTVVPVNPNHDEIGGLQCLSSLEELHEPVDLAILGVPNRLLEEELLQVAEASIPAAVIFASGFGEGNGDPSLIDRLKEIAVGSGITICGGNCMGFINFDRNLRALGFEEATGLEAGPIAWVSHSGSAFTALLHNDRGLRFNVAVSAGQELTTTVSDYMAYALDQSSTGIVALFIETVRDPQGFTDALQAASTRDIPVVVLKVGRDEQARVLVAAHSGALAGEDSVYDAIFETYGALRVDSLGEMADTLELFARGRRPDRGALAAIHDSGGQRALLVDSAAQVGVDLAELTDTTVARLQATLEPGLPAVNPLDAWGTGREFEKIYLECGRALLDDPNVAAFAFAVDLVGETPEWGYSGAIEQLERETAKPFAVLCSLPRAMDAAAARRLRAGGVPILEETLSGLAAFRNLFAFRDRTTLPLRGGRPVLDHIRRKWMRELETGGSWSGPIGLELLSDYGLHVATALSVGTVDEAIEAAVGLGFPVALKIGDRDHKSDVGGVALGISDELQLASIYRSMAERLGPNVVVQRMIAPGIELALGIVRDPQFGPVVVVAAGGIDVEILDDKQMGVPPLDRTRARKMIDGLQMRPRLGAARSGPPANLDAVTEAVVRISQVALDLGPFITALDVNPMIAGPAGCVAVDALVVPG